MSPEKPVKPYAIELAVTQIAHIAHIAQNQSPIVYVPIDSSENYVSQTKVDEYIERMRNLANSEVKLK